MREMKDSGVEWIGEVPTSWDMLRIYQLAFPVKNKNEGMKENNLLSLSYGRIIQKDINKVDGLVPASYEGYNIIEPGDIVLRFTDLQNDQKSLRTGLCNYDGIITSAYLTIRSQQDLVSPEYLHYVLHFVDTLKVFYNMGGGMRQSLDWHGISHMFLPIPPRAEQHRIVSYLDERCAAIDEDVAKRRVVIEKLREYKKSLIAHAVTKGLDPNAEMKDSGVEWIDDIPSKWGLTKIKFEALIRNGLDYSSEDVCSPERKGATLVVRSSNIRDGEMIHCDDVFVDMDVKGSCLLQHGDLVIVRANGSPHLVGKCALHNLTGKCAAGGFMLICRSAFNPYLRWVLQSGMLDCYRGSFDTSTIGRISSTMLGDMVIPWPSAEERIAITAFLNKSSVAIDEAISRQEQLIEKLGEYRKSIIHHAVTGKIDCTEA